jgi:formylglycine-generating enzyme required for sulfatase activity
MFHPNDKVGPYILIKFLGRGSFGEVWLGEKRTKYATTQCALKFPDMSKVDFDAIHKEAAMWVKASGHPNVLPIIEADEYDGHIVIVSELALDGSLGDWLKQRGGKAPSIDAAVKMMDGILAGLEHLHSKPITHRDLKPDNILLQGNTPRLADFGLARVLKTVQSTQNIAGTPLYMSPEAWRNIRTEQMDLWAAAVIFYQLLSGEAPFTGDDLPSLMFAILSNEAKPLSDTIAKPLRNFVSTALKKNLNERYPTAMVMRGELQKAYQQTLQVIYQPTVIMSEPAIIIDEFERRRQMDGFVLIPAGEFMMGGNQYDNEKPRHKVKISKAFEMGKYQVTQSLWTSIMGNNNNPSNFKSANFPVDQVSWHFAQAFIKELNAKNDGYVYRLPTEAEWEYACRAGTTYDYAGNLDEMGWYTKNSRNKTHAVGKKKANTWGLYDMHGNVWEWCADWYDGGYYRKSPEVNPKGPDSGSTRVLRGGGCYNLAALCRSANRYNFNPHNCIHIFGFRLVRTNA